MPDTLVQFHRSRARDAGMISDEARAFAADVRHAELTCQLAISALLIKRGADTPLRREIGVERIQDMILTLLDKEWGEINRRLDDAYGPVLPFPTLGDA